ncbi:MAG: LysR family transcriptional regulator [Betaproteobacteria bacterium]|nr:LysR family transcriptional regulator [Betaproteobacteria bacterium]
MPTLKSPSRASSRRIDAGNLRAFEAAARLGSFTAAARELFVTQSALSRQIQALEAEVGVALFLREGPRVRLAEAGERFAATLRPVLATLDDAVEDLRQSTRRPRVRITTFASFASLWLMPRLPLFQADHSDVDIAVEATDRLADLDVSGQDVAIRLVHPDNPLARVPGTKVLFEERIAPVCSPRLLAELQARGGLRTPADLRRAALIADVGSHGSSPSLARHIDALSWPGWFAAIGHAPVKPLGWLDLNFTHQAVQAALAGMGLAMGQMALVQHLLADGSLVLPLGPMRGSGYFYHLAQRTDAARRPEVIALVQWLQQQLQAPMQPTMG